MPFKKPQKPRPMRGIPLNQVFTRSIKPGSKMLFDTACTELDTGDMDLDTAHAYKSLTERQRLFYSLIVCNMVRFVGPRNDYDDIVIELPYGINDALGGAQSVTYYFINVLERKGLITVMGDPKHRKLRITGRFNFHSGVNTWIQSH